MDLTPASDNIANMGDVDLQQVLQPYSKELRSLAEAASKGERDKVIDGATALAVSISTGNPLLGALAPLGRKAIARAFGNATNAALDRELAKIAKEEERHAFLAQIDAVVEALVGQALIQLVRTQHSIKEEVLTALGGLREDFAAFRADFQCQLADTGETVLVETMTVQNGGIGIRVKSTTTRHVLLKHQLVSGPGSVGIDLE